MGSRKIGLFFLTVIFFLIFSESPQNFHSFYGIQEAHAQSFKVGSFTKASGAGQVVTHNLGVTPKALILWTNGKVSETGSQIFSYSFGMTDQTRASYSTAVGSQNVLPSNESSRMAAKALTIVQGGETVLAECDVSAWDTTTFTLMWTTNNSTAYVIHYIIIGGTDVTSKVVRWTMATTVPTNVSVTGVGFRPDAVIHAHLGADFTSAPPANMVHLNLGLGVMDASGSQWANVVYSRDNVSTTDTQRGQQTDACLIDIYNDLSVTVKASFRSMDADGFTVNFSTGGYAGQVVSLALAGINAKAGSFGKTVPAPAYVRGAEIDAGAASSATITLPAASTSGNLIVLSFNYNNQAANVTSVTDNKGNSYIRAIGPTDWDGTTERAYTYYASNIIGGTGAITIKITLSAATTSYFEVWALEYSGVSTVSPLDQTSVGTGTGTAMDSGSKTTTFANELLYGWGLSSSNCTAPGAPWTTRSTFNSNFVVDQSVASTGSYNVTGTNGSSAYRWAVHMLTFKGSGATQAVRGVGFQPSAVLLSSFQDVAQASPVADSRFGIGAADATTGGSAAFNETNALTALPINRAIDKTSRVFMKYNQNTDWVPEAQATLTSMDADGFTLNWTTNDAVATEIVYLVLGVPGTASFQYKRQITINALDATTCSSQTLSSFPVLISLSGSWLRTQANDPTNGRIQNANGYDIIFRDGSNNQLDHEIEKYDGGASAGTLVAWVRIPTLPQAGTTIYMYYGNSAITKPTANSTGVWGSDYQSVWHLGSNLLDSTNSKNDGTDSGGSSSVTGNVGLARSFDGSDDYIYTANAITSGYTNLTLEAWVKTSTANGHPILSWEGTNRTGTANTLWDSGLYVGTNQDLYFYVYNGGGYYPRAVGSYNDGTWHHLVGVSDSATGFSYVYVDGSLAGSAGRVNLNTNSRYWRIGSYKNAGSSNGADGYFNGQVDEVRISTAARSACWIRTEYDNQKTGSTLVGIGAEGGAAPTAVKLTSFTANQYPEGVLLKWKTGYEVDNLGFHVYRGENGNLIRLTPEPVAGSALIAGSRTALTAGHHYHWWDASLDTRPSTLATPKYWLKDIDLNGTETMHGPAEIQTSVISDQLPVSKMIKPELLSELGLRLNERYHHYWRVQDLKDKLRQKPSTIRHQPSSLFKRASNLKGRRPAPQGNLVPDPQTQQFLAGKPGAKLFVKEEGWYRVTQPELVAAGLSPKVNPHFLHLYVDGREQPIRVIGGRDGRFGPRDAIEFYGVGLDTPSTDTRVYWLVEGFKPGKRIHEFRGYSGSLGSLSFPYTVEVKDRWIYLPAIKNGEEENFFGAVVYGAGVDQLLGVKHLDLAASEDAFLEVVLQGATNTSHRVKVLLNKEEVGEVVFEGQSKGLFQVEVPQAFLREGDNLVSFIPLGGEMDISLVDTIRLTYWRTYTADDNGLRFAAQGGSHLTLGGFSSSRVRVFDITDPGDVVEALGKVESQKGGYAVSFRVPGTGQRTLLAMTEEGVKTSEGVVANQPSSWHQSKDGYDLVIVTHRDFLDALQSLKKLRESQELRVALVDVEDVYDEFSFGNKSPKAIKDFLASAKSNWRRAPRFVLLVGDASFDPKNYFGLGDFDFVPTKLVDTVYMETASDDWFVDLNSDGLPEMAIGRLPLSTVEEAGTVVSKIVGYEKTRGRKEALLVADKAENSDDFNFEGASEEVRALLPSFLMVRKIYRGQFGSDAQANGVLLSAINQGPLLVNFIGHGSMEIWRGVLTSEDAEGLINGMRLPFFVNMTCLNGYFQDPYSETLGEALLKAKQGGAVAVWASSGLTEPDKQAIMNKELIKLLFGRESLTLGEATVRAKAFVSDQDIRKTWILFGDPSTRLQ